MREMNIEQYKFSNEVEYNPKEPRKLLLHKKEIKRLIGLTSIKGNTLVALKVYEKNGFIKGYHADLQAEKLGFEVTVFAMVGLHNQAESDLRQFEERILSLPYVRECHMLNGEIDFILKCVAPDLSTFQSFLTKELTSAPNVASVKTSLTIRQSKHSPGIPINLED